MKAVFCEAIPADNVVNVVAFNEHVRATHSVGFWIVVLAKDFETGVWVKLTEVSRTAVTELFEPVRETRLSAAGVAEIRSSLDFRNDRNWRHSRNGLPEQKTLVTCSQMRLEK